MSERPDTEPDSMWTRGFFAVPPPASAGPDAEWRGGYRYLAHLTRREGRPVVDGLVITGPDINAGALRALKGLRSDVALVGDIAEKGWREKRPIDDAFAQFLASWPWGSGDAEGTAASEDAERLPLTRPDGTDPEGFSRRVAEAYREAARATSAPAKAIAAEAGVPVTTVHRWIRDARRLGFLGPARKGRAG